MIRSILLPLVLAFSFAAQAAPGLSVLDNLKSKPLTSYEAGKNQLETLTLAFNLAAKFKGEKDFWFTVIEHNNMLGLEVAGYQPVAKVTKKECESGFKKISGLGVTSDIPKLIWPGLSDQEIEDVKKELFVRTKYIAKENHEFSISCSRSLSEL